MLHLQRLRQGFRRLGRHIQQFFLNSRRYRSRFAHGRRFHTLGMINIFRCYFPNGFFRCRRCFLNKLKSRVDRLFFMCFILICRNFGNICVILRFEFADIRHNNGRTAVCRNGPLRLRNLICCRYILPCIQSCRSCCSQRLIDCRFDTFKFRFGTRTQ